MITEFFRSRSSAFRTRSAERDQQSDSMTVGRVMKAIDQAIETCSAERAGLANRLADVTSRAAIFAGNGSDDYDNREKAVSDRLSALDAELKSAQHRIERLAYSISQFEFLRDELRSRLCEPGGQDTWPTTGNGAQRQVATH